MTSHPLPTLQLPARATHPDGPPQVPHLSPPHDAVLVPAVHALIAPYVERALDQIGPAPTRADQPLRSLPGLRSDAFLTASHDVQLAVLLLLGSRHVFADPELTVRMLLKQVSRDIHGAVPPGGWGHLAATLVPHEEMQRRRYPPDGDRDRWVREGDTTPRGDVA